MYIYFLQVSEVNELIDQKSYINCWVVITHANHNTFLLVDTGNMGWRKYSTQMRRNFDYRHTRHSVVFIVWLQYNIFKLGKYKSLILFEQVPRLEKTTVWRILAWRTWKTQEETGFLLHWTNSRLYSVEDFDTSSRLDSVSFLNSQEW